MKWQLTAPHHIDEQVLPAGTIIGDETAWPYRAPKDDPKIKRKKGDALPPSNSMVPLDDEARKLFKLTYGDEAPPNDPTLSIPLTGAPNAPKVAPQAAPPAARPAQTPVNTKPDDEAPKTGMAAEPAKT